VSRILLRSTSAWTPQDTISVAVLAPDRDGPDVERIAHDEASVRRPLAAFPIPGCPWSGAPSCEQPTCGFDPRTSVWRFADPPCPGAPCQPGSPAATGIGGSHVRPPSVLMQPRATSAVTLPVPNHAIYQRQIRPLGKPLHIRTPAVDRDPHGWVACRRSWQARARCCCRRRHNDQRTRWPRSRAGRFADRRDRPRVPGPRADHQAPGSRNSRCEIQNSLAMLEVCWD
jgi:hypothetical protein